MILIKNNGDHSWEPKKAKTLEGLALGDSKRTFSRDFTFLKL